VAHATARPLASLRGPHLLNLQRFRSADALLRVSLWAVLVAVITFTRADPDLWGHVRFGSDILRDWSIPDRDIYSFTSDRAWVNHEWAAEVMTGASFLAAGAAGLVLVKLAVICGVLLLLERAMRAQGVEQPRTRDYLAAVAVITTVQQAHHVRPQIFSLLFFAMLLTCLTEAQRGNRRWLFALPPLFAVWTNFHGGWIVGGGILVLWTVGAAIGSGVRAAVPYLSAGAASLIATIANPYGLGMWRFLHETVGFGRADITDWQPIYALDASVWLLWLATAALSAIAFLRARRATLDPARVIVVATLALASFRVNRLLGFFALATLFLVGSAIAQSFSRRPAGRQHTHGGRLIATILAVTLIAGAAFFIARHLSCIRLDPRMTPGAGAVTFLTGRKPGRLVVWFDWGEYAIWHLAPDFKVSTDGRRETVYSADLQNRHLRFFFDAPGGATLPDELGADYVWIPSHLPAVRRLTSTAWAQIYADDDSAIFARGDTQLPPHSGGVPPVRSQTLRCFPGP
jgi:hypothetical protein